MCLSSSPQFRQSEFVERIVLGPPGANWWNCTRKNTEAICTFGSFQVSVVCDD